MTDPAPSVMSSGVGSERPAPRALLRSTDDRLLAGVCGGLADYFAIDAIWFRLGFVVLGLSGGSSVLLYLIMWLIVPERTAGDGPPSTPRARPPVMVMVGLALIGVGAMSMAHAINPDLGRLFWPVVLVVGGVVLLSGGWSNDRNE